MGTFKKLPAEFTGDESKVAVLTATSPDKAFGILYLKTSLQLFLVFSTAGNYTAFIGRSKYK